MSIEKQKAWEAQQRIEELERARNGLASQNTVLRQERNAAIASGHTSQVEAMTLGNRLAAKAAEVEELRLALHSVGARLEELQVNSSVSQSKFIVQEMELLRLREEIPALRGSHNIAVQSVQQLTGDNASLRQQVTALSGIQEERDELQKENKHLSSRIKLLKSQVGSFMVGNGRVGKSYYVLQAMSHIPVIGSLIHRTSEEVYNAHQKPRK